METLVCWICPSPSTHAKVGRRLQFVIPTGADPDFLLRGTHQRPRVRLSVKKAAWVRQRHQHRQEIRGSV